MTVQVVDLDFSSEQQVRQFLSVLRAYAAEDGGGNKELSRHTETELPRLLSALPGRQVLAALDEGAVVGVAVCLGSFSTFRAKPVLNIHDLAVLPTHRGQGIGSALLEAAEARARELGCCKMTLEVISTNDSAHRLYNRRGFESPTAKVPTFFLEKPL